MISFTKAHAFGNDFLIVAEEATAGQDWAQLTVRLCARNTGVGADGIEFFAWTNRTGAGVKSGRIRLHNADGSIAEISGTGTRCVAAWMAEQLGSAPGDELEIATDAGPRVCRIIQVGRDDKFAVEVRTGMGVPSIRHRAVRLKSGVEIAGAEVSTGDPHFVIVADDDAFTVAGRPWMKIGAENCTHADFPTQINVEFLRVVDRQKIEIRIFERGVGSTTSSGTGTSVTATAALALHGCVSPLTVVAPGGAQAVEWGGAGGELYLTGPAALIARGEAW